jgi:hypothetical protein
MNSKSFKIGCLLIVLSVVLSSVAYAFTYETKTQSVGQAIINKPNYFVNQLSNVDSSPDIGTHSNFTAQQYGPDSISDNLTEANAGESATFGKTNIGSTSTGYTGWLEASRYQCAQTGSVANITLYLSGGAAGRYARVAIYSDSSGAPNSLLSQSSQQEITSNGWRTFTGFNVSVSTNTYYWLAFQISTSSLQFRYDTGVTDQHAYSSYTYGSFPSSFGTPGYYGTEAQSIYASILSPNYRLDLEEQWINVDYHETNEQLCLYCPPVNNTYSLNATGGYMLVGSGTPNWGSSSGTISFWIKWAVVGGRPWGQHENMETRFSGSNLILDWGAVGSLTSTTSFIADKWYFIAIAWNEGTDKLTLYVGDQNISPTVDVQNTGWASAVSTVGVTQNNFLASKGGIEPTNGKGEDLRYWNVERTLSALQSNYNMELTGSETNLRSYFKLNNNFVDIGPDNNNGSSSGSCSFSSDVPFGGLPAESILVDVRNGAAWQNVFTNLASGWNNVTVSAYLTSSTFTIRFRSSIITGDIMQDVWKIDAALLHCWS